MSHPSSFPSEQSTDRDGLDARQAGLDETRAAALLCQQCDLWTKGTQTVFGHGDAGAVLMLVGERPNEEDDRQGEPFLGPAGEVLRAALVEAGLAQVPVYTTTAVKHFGGAPDGTESSGARPSLSHLVACRTWLEAEILAVSPRVVVALGAIAALAVLGRSPWCKWRRHSTRDASPWAVLLLVQICPIFSLVAPCPRGASRLSVLAATCTTGC